MANKQNQMHLHGKERPWQLSSLRTTFRPLACARRFETFSPKPLENDSQRFLMAWVKTDSPDRRLIFCLFEKLSLHELFSFNGKPKDNMVIAQCARLTTDISIRHQIVLQMPKHIHRGNRNDGTEHAKGKNS